MKRLGYRSGVRLQSLVGRNRRHRLGRLLVRRGGENLVRSLLRNVRRLS